jgi:hypothetical protein
MPIPVPCPSCGRTLFAQDAASGGHVECPKCNAFVAVPTPGAADDFEVVEGSPTTRARVVPVKPAAAKPVPLAPKGRGDDEDDERPRKSRKKAAKKKQPPVILLAVGSGVALLGLVVGVVWLIGFDAKVPVPVVGNVLDSTPSGFTEVRDTEAGYRVLLPGQVGKQSGERVRENVPPGYEMSFYSGKSDSLSVSAMSVWPGVDFIKGTSQGQLFGYLKDFGGGVGTGGREIVSQTPVTLGGRSGLEVRQRDKPRKTGAATKSNPWLNDHQVFFVTTVGKRLVIIRIDSSNTFPDDATLKTVTDSFKFL